MRLPRSARALALSVVVTGAVLVGTAEAAPAGHVRLDQVGYGLFESKQAYLLVPTPTTARFQVQDSRGRTVLTGDVGPSRGAWSDKFQAVQPIDFSALKRAGTYRIKVGATTSPPFKIGANLFDPIAARTVEFFQAQRDGANVVPGRLDREPAHLTDREATVYDTPIFKGDGGDELAEPLKPLGLKVDVEGGWFDAGDFVKFTHASAYSTASMLFAQRDEPTRALKAETKFGLDWLNKIWDSHNKVLYAQVGIELTSWPSSEPAIDFTATAVLAFSLG